jgi:hypothetical protein
MSFVTNVPAMKMTDAAAFVRPTFKQRLQNYAEPAILFYLGLYCKLAAMIGFTH